MPKLEWNYFLNVYNKKISYRVIVSSNLQKGLGLDYNRRELPSPFDLFCDWCASYLSGDWTTKIVENGFIVCILETKDEKILKDEFSIIGPAKTTIAGNNTLSIEYKKLQYDILAGDLGYVI